MTKAAFMTAGVLINIDVDDLDRAVAFYTAAFGLKVGRRFGAAAVELTGGAAPIYLLCKAGGTVANPASDERRRYARHWTPVHLDFVVPDLDAAVEVAVAAGAKLEEQPATHAWGKIAPLADPFGHGLCLIEFVGRGYDEIATR
ncbi:MAG TPA: VOC family protein [Hyphomicrobiaceae bacterium]|jgi:predicted enzyme related to lactoylglutathione lyase|nr:VOC family protein [Hyphomicrobiaceae bacterium]